MALSFIGAGTAGSTTSTSVSAVGDLLIAFAFRDGSTTAPTLPAGWSNIGTVVGSTCSLRVAYKVATSTNEVTGAFTNATTTICNAYRGQSVSDPIGAVASSSGTTNSINIPALTLEKTDNTSWVAAALAHRSVDTNTELAFTGTTTRQTGVDATDEMSGYDTNGPVSSWTSKSRTGTGTASGWIGYCVEIRAKPTYTPGQNIAAGESWVAGSGATLSFPGGNKVRATAPTTGINPRAIKFIKDLDPATTYHFIGTVYQGTCGDNNSYFVRISTASDLSSGDIYQYTAAAGDLTAPINTGIDGITQCYIGFVGISAADGDYIEGDDDFFFGELAPAGSYTIEATPGDFTITGTNATLKVARKLSTTVGTYAISGTNATLRIGKKLSATPGSFSLAGANATLKTSRRLTAQGGSFAINSVNATLRKGQTLSLTPGSFTITGTNATLKRGRKISATPGALAIAGTSINLRISRRLTCQVGSYDIIGSSADLTATTASRTLFAQNGSFAITGQNVTLRKSSRIIALPGSLAIAGTSATIKRGRKIIATPGAFALTGMTSSLRRTRRIVATPGLFSISGSSATFNKGINWSITPGAYVLDGQLMSLRAIRRLTCLPGAFTIGGVAARLSRNLRFIAIPSSYAINPASITLRRTFRIENSPGLIAIDGNDAVLARNYGWTLNPGSFLISGVDAEIRKQVGYLGKSESIEIDVTVESGYSSGTSRDSVFVVSVPRDEITALSRKEGQ